eukprot:TRINITY_DN60209_c0_g1_i1.p1 TRINITY_DN60209_c0_g1~~TRINITY_DN60209_c0_g1_i1.p1  ORF type:complete len:559 (+),score=129.89 TRINITY_DN60209_c0_g1_i1:67-1743(+)
MAGREARSGISAFLKDRRAAAQRRATSGGEPVVIQVRPAAGGPSRPFTLSPAGEPDLGEIGAAFALREAHLETASGQLALTFTAGAEYIVRGKAAAGEVPGLAVAKRRRVGYCCPPECLLHEPPRDRLRSHPERPERVARAEEQLRSQGLAALLEPIAPVSVDAELLRLCHVQGVALGALERCYGQGAAPLPFVAALRRSGSSGGAHPERAERMRFVDTLLAAPRSAAPEDPPALANDCYTSEGSPGAVRAAVGGVVACALRVASGACGAAFCLIRPPGHHCDAHAPSGFCLVNNVALAARALQRAHPGWRVAIVDFDVHHGNGTQAIFERDPSVLFMSVHRHDGGRFYPHTGAATEVGLGAGVGLTLNVAFDTEGGAAPLRIGDHQFESCARRVFAPALAAWRPDIVLVSAGFDAAAGDPVGKQGVTSGGFACMTHWILEGAGAAGVVFALEGGYRPAGVADGVEACVRTLLGAPPPAAPAPAGTHEAAWTLGTLLRTLRAHAACAAGGEQGTALWEALQQQHQAALSELDALTAAPAQRAGAADPAAEPWPAPLVP